jgi:hypothetical protein
MEDTYVSDDRASSPISLVVVVSDGYMSRDLLLLFNFCFFFFFSSSDDAYGGGDCCGRMNAVDTVYSNFK